MDDFTPEDVRAALVPLTSLLSKSEKSQTKLAPGTWQHTMLADNIAALRIAEALMRDEPAGAGDVSHDTLTAALQALASMIGRTEKSMAMFPPGTSQHTLQRNRLKALRIAEALVARRASTRP